MLILVFFFNPFPIYYHGYIFHNKLHGMITANPINRGIIIFVEFYMYIEVKLT